MRDKGKKEKDKAGEGQMRERERMLVRDREAKESELSFARNKRERKINRRKKECGSQKGMRFFMVGIKIISSNNIDFQSQQPMSYLFTCVSVSEEIND